MLVMSKEHVKIMHELRQHFLLQCQYSVHVIARLKLHTSMSVTVVPPVCKGAATKLGGPTITTARMVMPKLSAPVSMAVCPPVWQR